MKYSIRLHQIIAVIGFVVLVAVQGFLIYNTYKLQDDEFYAAEKALLRDQYKASIRNDKIFPGGQLIIDSYLMRNMRQFERWHQDSPNYFEHNTSVIIDSVFAELKEKNNIDSLMYAFLESNQLDTSLIWAASVNAISITFDGIRYVPLYHRDQQPEKGILVNGGLASLNKNNEVAAITVSSPEAYTYSMTFALHADLPHRTLAILKSMALPLSIVLFSILTVILIYYFTFRNWIQQKKLAELKSDFVNSITHEFHTPLTAIIVANKSLQNERILEQRDMVHELTAVIDRQSQRLKSLFGQVLDLTVMNASSLQKKTIFLEELLEELLLDYRLQLGAQQVSIQFNSDHKRSKVLLDTFWTTTMINNLLDNAIKYNNSKKKEIWVNTTSLQDQVVVQIRDNGVGISPKALQHIFDKFYRNLEKVDNRATNGLGLGLFYAKQCMDAHGWKWDIQSEEGEGTRFIIHIPLEP